MYMKKGFVHTANFRRLAEAHKLVAQRGAREAGLVIVQGVYGVGKSELTERWAADNNAVFLRCKQTWTKRALLDELAEKMGIDKRGRNQQVQARIIGKLAVEMVPMMFDEADHLINSTASLLEVVRDITDITGVMCFLVGMEHFASKLIPYGHIASRVARVIDLQPLDIADVKAACNAMSEVKLSDEVIVEMHAQCKGCMRLLLNAIATVEQWAHANTWSSVTLENIKGRALCVEFTGKTLRKIRVSV
jgi:DNA transposition AAA+ family ATPase